MVKQFIQDTFEKLAEEGRELTVGTAKKAAQELFNLEKTPPLRQGSAGQAELHESENTPKNFTEIDKGALGETYKKQDEASMESIKMRLFQNVQGESMAAHKATVRLEQERSQSFNKPAEMMQENMSNMPKGKHKKNMFGGKRKAVATMENKPAKGT